MNLKIKISIPVGIAILCGLLIIAFFTVSNIKQIRFSVYQQEKEALNQYFTLKLDSQKQTVIKMAMTLAENNYVISALKENNRDIAISGLKSLIKNYQTYSDIKDVKIHLHDKKLRSFVRLWNLNKYGDDLSGFRDSIVSVQKNNSPINAIEVGRAGLLLRGIAPVNMGKHYLGSIEFIENFDLIARHAKEQSIDIIFIMDKKYQQLATKSHDAKNINAQFVLASDPEQINLALFSQLSKIELLNSDKTADYLYTTSPIVDFKDNIVGYAIIARHLNSIEGVIKHAESALYSQVWMMLLTSLVVLTALFYAIHRLLFVPIEKMASEINNSIDQQDLTQKLSYVKNDEIGKIAQAYNNFTSLINNFITYNHESAIDISDAANIMSATNTNTSNSIQNQEVETTEVTENLSIMLEQVQDIAENSQHALNSANKASEQAINGKNLSEKTIISIKSLADEIQGATQVIEQLQEESLEIENFTSVIQSIAEQTNLLALNAAIEAARAGESGRGFAVVADEVRNLAEKTQDSTKQISTIISRLKSSINNVVGVMEVSNEKAFESVSAIDETEQVLVKITDSVHDIKDINEGIARVTQEQVPLFINLSANMSNNVKQFTVMLNSSLEDTAIASSQLGHSVKEMYEQMKTFKINSSTALKLYNAKTFISAWKTRMQSYINHQTDMDEADHATQTTCQFAEWFYSSATDSFQEFEEFAELEQVHNNLHVHLDELVKLKNHTDFDSESFKIKANQLNATCDEILSLMDQIAAKAGIQRESKFNLPKEQESSEIELF